MLNTGFGDRIWTPNGDNTLYRDADEDIHGADTSKKRLGDTKESPADTLTDGDDFSSKYTRRKKQQRREKDNVFENLAKSSGNNSDSQRWQQPVTWAFRRVLLMATNITAFAKVENNVYIVHENN